MASHIVTVAGVACSVTTVQEAKTVWIAVGKYIEAIIDVTGQSEKAALRNWHNAARYKED